MTKSFQAMNEAARWLQSLSGPESLLCLCFLEGLVGLNHESGNLAIKSHETVG